MPLLADFVVIQGDNRVKIGDPSQYNEWSKTFDTGGRRKDGFAFLIFNVKGLTHTEKKVVVEINGTPVGDIYPYFPGGADVVKTDIDDANKKRHMGYWYTQMINVGGNMLKDGNNTIRIHAVDFPGCTGANKYDDFELKDVICFFQQKAGA